MDLSSTSIYPAQHTQPSHSTPNNQQAKFQNEHQATSHPNLCMPVYEQHSQYMLKIEQHDADSDMMKSELHHSPSVQNDQHSYEHAPQHSSRQVYQDTSAVHSPDYNECMSPNSQQSIEGTPVKKRGRPKGSLNKKTIWGNSLGNPDQEAPVLPIPKVPSLTASGKRKGRPPGSKNKKTLALEQFVDHEAFLSTDTPSDFTNEPVLYDTPSTPNSIIDASSLSENSLSVTQFNKRKGRPPGSKNKKTLAAERGDPYVDNKTHERRPRGRPKTNTAPCDPSSEKRRRGRPVFNPQIPNGCHNDITRLKDVIERKDIEIQYLKQQLENHGITYTPYEAYDCDGSPATIVMTDDDDINETCTVGDNQNFPAMEFGLMASSRNETKHGNMASSVDTSYNMQDHNDKYALPECDKIKETPSAVCGIPVHIND